ARLASLGPCVRGPARRSAATGVRLGRGAAALNSARRDSYEWSAVRSSGRAAVTVAALTTALGVMRDRGGTPQRQATPAPSAATALAPVQATKAIRQAERRSSAAGAPGKPGSLRARAGAPVRCNGGSAWARRFGAGLRASRLGPGGHPLEATVRRRGC